MRLLLSLVVALSAGCSKSPDLDPFYPAIPSPNPAKEKDENEIRLIAFQKLLKGASTGDICFIEFRELGVQGRIYPSNDFMSRLVYPHLTLRKVTEARFPAKGEKDPTDPQRYQGIRDPATGKRCYVYSVRIEWLAPDRAKAHAELDGGPLSGGGFEYLIVREAGAWVYKETVGSWAN